jgi:gamma-glutamylcyclotransferase (GGCT)/AIG2-like uncharacterized protein YtfP
VAGRRSRLYFAYGSNMHEPSMRIRCPRSRMVGTGCLRGWRFIINAQGYASVVAAADGEVWGVLWLVAPRDETALDHYEDVDDGLYRKASAIAHTSRGDRRDVLVYIATDQRPGRPRQGYMPLLLSAAARAGLPARYIDALRAWA